MPVGFGPRRPDRFRRRGARVITPEIQYLDPTADWRSGGRVITITGVHFRLQADGGAPDVTFNGVAATDVTVVSDTVLTCVAPAQSEDGLVDVIITIDGMTGTFYGAFTYYGPVITRVSPAYGTFAGGTDVVIEGVNFADDVDVTFGGDPATDITVLDSGHITCKTPAHGTGFVDVVVTNHRFTFSPSAFGDAFAVTEQPELSATYRLGFQFTLFTRGNDIRRQPGISISKNLGRSPNTAMLVIDGRSNIPVCGEQIELFDGATKVFAGNVQGVEQCYEQDGQIDQLYFSARCIDASWLFNKRRPFGKYTNVSATDVVKDLVSRYAPGFSTDFVQTNLGRVTVTFDGTQDLFTCLQMCAQAIGNGHVYVDDDWQVHFFRVVPRDLNVPGVGIVSTVQLSTPEAAMTTLPSDAADAAVETAAAFPWPNGQGFIASNISALMFGLRVTFVYDNGFESSWGPITPFEVPQERHRISIQNLPLGPTVNGHVCTARRLYWVELEGYGHAQSPCVQGVVDWIEVSDNVTTSVTLLVGNAATSGDSTLSGTPANVLFPFVSTRPRRTPYIAPVPGPTIAVHVSQGSQDVRTTHRTITCRDGSQLQLASLQENFNAANPSQQLANGTTFTRAMSYSYGTAQKKWFYTFLYENGAQSLPSPASGIFAGDGYHSIAFDNLQLGPNINGIRCIARLVYYQTGSAVTPVPWFAIWDNTSTSAEWYHPPSQVTFIGAVCFPINAKNTAALSLDDAPESGPHIDGPSLEDTLPIPDDIDDDNEDLLRDPQFKVDIDMSQLRNRVFGRGGASSLSADLNAGAQTADVNDVSQFDSIGGQVILGNEVLTYSGVSGTDPGNGTLYLTSAPTNDYPAGTALSLFIQVDDLASQNYIGHIELDNNGDPTDGVHEFTVIDTSLTSMAQLKRRCEAELEIFSRPIMTVSYGTRDAKTRPGATVHIDLSNPPCKGDFLIQEVRIDQLQDESDMLTARYTVQASSVRFNLNDLLLMIGESGSTSTSIGFSAVGLAGDAAAQDLSTNNADTIPKVPVRTRKMNWSVYLIPTNIQATTAPIIGGEMNSGGAGNAAGSVAASGTGSSLSGTNDADGYWYRMKTGTDSSQEVRLECPASAFCWLQEHRPTVEWVLRTGSDISTQRIMVGLVDANSHMPMSDADGTVRYVAFQYSSISGVAGWQCVTANGAGQNRGAVASIAANTIYRMRIEVLDTQSIVFSINEAQIGSMNWPGAAQAFVKFEMRMQTGGGIPSLGSGQQRFIDWKQVYAEYFN